MQMTIIHRRPVQKSNKEAEALKLIIKKSINIDKLRTSWMFINDNKNLNAALKMYNDNVHQKDILTLQEYCFISNVVKEAMKDDK